MKKKYKILVLSDLKETTTSIIKSGVSLAKMIDADLHMFHVRKAIDIVDKDNQLSAKRSINKSFIKTNNMIQDMIDPLSKDYNINIHFYHSFGNVKDEIRKHIKKQQPDVILLGKRKSNPIKLFGDNITDFVIKNFKGEIIITSEKNHFELNKELSLGLLNHEGKSVNADFANNLIGHSNKPLKLFNTSAKKVKGDSNVLKSKETVELQFDYGENSIKSLSNYLSKSDIDLLIMDRMDNKKVINNVNVPVLISKSMN